MAERISFYKPQGELALLLNNFKNRDPRRNESHIDFYLTNECDRYCAMCYTNSAPGLKNTRLNLGIAYQMMDDFKGSDYTTLTGGEVSIIPGIVNIIKYAGDSFRKVYVQTNASGFIRPRSFRTANPEESVYYDLVNSFTEFPPNAEIDVPLTKFHMLPELGGKKVHIYVVKAAARLAHEWNGQDDKAQIRFIAKKYPGHTKEIVDLITDLDIRNYAKTGMDNYPGNITTNGRGANLSHSLDARGIETKSLDLKFEGGFSVNYKGIYINEGPLLYDLLPPELRGQWLVKGGKVYEIDSETTYSSVRKSMKEFLLSQVSPTD